MAIYFTKKFESVEECEKEKRVLHDALVGSPAYINSEIAIVQGDTDCEFILCVGNDNFKNLHRVNNYVED